MPNSFPALRPGLEIIPQGKSRKGDRAGFLLRDPRTGEVFEMEEEEFFLCQQLDGATSLPVIQERYESRFGNPLSLEELEAFVAQLGREGILLNAADQGHVEELAKIFDIEEWRPRIRLEVCNPDVFFGFLYRLTYWLFWPVSKICLGLLMAGAVYVLLVHGGALWDAMATHWAAPSLWSVVMFFFNWIVLCEGSRCLSRGLVMKHLGIKPDQFIAIMAYRIFPIIWVLTTERWVLVRKGKLARMIYASSGLYGQFLLLGLAIMAWKLTWSGTFANSCWLTIVEAVLFRLIIHDLNPLVVMDVYLTLMFWLEIPKLRERAMQTAAAWLFGHTLPEPLTPAERKGFILYGLLGAMWTVGFLIFILSKAASKLTWLFKGPGALLFILVVLYILPRPLRQYLAKPFHWLLASEAGVISRRYVRLGWLLLVIGVLFIPYPYETGGSFALLPAVQTEVHCEIDGGRIMEVFVREGAFVRTGQPIGQIDRREYERNLQADQAQLENTEAQLRLLRTQLALLQQPPYIEQIQKLEADVRRLRTLVADDQKQLELTTLRAPVTGRLTTPLIDQKVGQYLKKGDLFATVEQAQAVQVEIQIPESDAPQVRIGARVKIVHWAHPKETFYGVVRDVAPIAAISMDPTTAFKINSVRVIAELTNVDLRFKSNITGYAKIKAEKKFVWQVLLDPLIRYIQVQVWYWLP